MGRTTIFVVGSFLLAICGACNRNLLGLQGVSGSVSFDATPVKEGSIRFVPTDNKGRQTGTVISDGRYSISANKGLSLGKYIVQIFAPDPNKIIKTANMGDGPAQTFGELIPEKYNVKSELLVDIAAEGTRVFDFALGNP